MACTHPYWSALQVGSQHIARQLVARGWRVIYLSAPVTLLHLLRLSSFEVRRRFGAALRGPTVHCEGRLEAYVPLACLGPDGREVLRHPLISANWWCTALNGSLRSILREREVSLLYIDNLSYAFLLDRLVAGRAVFRVMDRHERFGGWEGRAHQLAVRIAGQVDLTVYSAESLKGYVQQLGAGRTLCVPNGVDYAALANAKTVGLPRPTALTGIPGPVVLYSGVIDGRIDFSLVATAARRLGDVSFVFIGPVAAGLKRPELPRNVFFVGAVDHEELPRYMAHAVAGIAPFDVSDGGVRVQGVRPLKVLEYMAAGLPAITASWDETTREGIPVWQYRDADEFVALVHRAVSGVHDLDAGLAYAKASDWSEVVGCMLGALEIA